MNNMCGKRYSTITGSKFLFTDERMPKMYILILLLFFHWFFDFILQPRSWADEKWCNMLALIGHTSVYGLGLFCFAACPWLGLPRDLGAIFMFTGLNWFLHGFTDFFTSKVNHMYYESKKYYQFFGMIGFDQFIHVATLLITLQYFFHITVGLLQ